MSTKDDGGPAFARPFSKNGEFSDSQQNRSQEGMSLRDYFAAKAMASLTSVYWEDFDQYASGAHLIKCLSETAYEMADAMIAERAK